MTTRQPHPNSLWMVRIKAMPKPDAPMDTVALRKARSMFYSDARHKLTVAGFREREFPITNKQAADAYAKTVFDRTGVEMAVWEGYFL